MVGRRAGGEREDNVCSFHEQLSLRVGITAGRPSHPLAFRPMMMCLLDPRCDRYAYTC